jgi:hypothetical protein
MRCDVHRTLRAAQGGGRNVGGRGATAAGASAMRGTNGGMAAVGQWAQAMAGATGGALRRVQKLHDERRALGRANDVCSNERTTGRATSKGESDGRTSRWLRSRGLVAIYQIMKHLVKMWSNGRVLRQQAKCGRLTGRAIAPEASFSMSVRSAGRELRVGKSAGRSQARDSNARFWIAEGSMDAA